MPNLLECMTHCLTEQCEGCPCFPTTPADESEDDEDEEDNELVEYFRVCGSENKNLCGKTTEDDPYVSFYCHLELFNHGRSPEILLEIVKSYLTSPYGLRR